MAHTLSIFARTADEIVVARDDLRQKFPNDIISYDLAPEPVDVSKAKDSFRDMRYGITLTLDIAGGKKAYTQARTKLAYLSGSVNSSGQSLGIGWETDPYSLPKRQASVPSLKHQHANLSVFIGLSQ